MTVWKSVGYYMVLFLVGLKDIPVDYYEAASIDGPRPGTPDPDHDPPDAPHAASPTW